MRKTKLNTKGLGLIGVLVVIVVLVIAAGTGAYIYHQDHKIKVATSTGSKTTSSTSKSGSGSSTAANPYAGWKTYCDSVYGYCFKYPNDWILSTNSTPTEIGGTGQVEVANPTNTVDVSYANAFVKDSNSISLTTTYISKLTTANEDLTIVGGYSPAVGLVGNYLSSYHVVDSSFLTSYPLTVGQTSQFPSNPAFTDQSTGVGSYQGSLTVEAGFNTQAQAQAWFSTPDVKTSLLILESLYYSK